VDNAAHKPPDFWHWLIWEVKRRYPDVLFLAEAFTRPARQYGLAKLGFTQSYTYFTWRTGKQELIDFMVDWLEHADEGRPNLFVNTPDILHESLQHGGPAMFAPGPRWPRPCRRPGACTRGTSCTSTSRCGRARRSTWTPRVPAAGRVTTTPRCWTARSLEPWLTKLNQVRKAHPALHQLRHLRFQSNDADDHTVSPTRQQPLWLDLPELGIEWHERSPLRRGHG